MCITLIAISGCGQTSDSIANGTGTHASSSSQSSNSSQNNESLFHLGYGANAMQIGELRLPTGIVSSPVPLVIIIHGGCWTSAFADFHSMDKFAEAITGLGYATWNIEYRAIGTGGEWPVIFQDVGSAIDFSNLIAQQHNINLQKVAIIGHSAGGHLALWAAGRNKIPQTSTLYVSSPLTLRGVISLGGIADLTRNNACYAATGNIIGLPPDSSDPALNARLQETSPQQMLPVQTRTILISGSLDNIVPPQIGADYVAQAIVLGGDSVHYVVNGAGHSDLIDPERTDWLLYQQSLQEIFTD